MRKIIGRGVVWAQTTFLITSGIAVIWFSTEMKDWVMYMIGYEYALGAENVIRGDDGSVLLTNPGAMIRWRALVCLFGAIQFSAGISLLVCVCHSKRISN